MAANDTNLAAFASLDTSPQLGLAIAGVLTDSATNTLISQGNTSPSSSDIQQMVTNWTGNSGGLQKQFLEKLVHDTEIKFTYAANIIDAVTAQLAAINTLSVITSTNAPEVLTLSQATANVMKIQIKAELSCALIALSDVIKNFIEMNKAIPSSVSTYVTKANTAKATVGLS